MFCQNGSRRGESHLDKRFLILVFGLAVSLLCGCDEAEKKPDDPAFEPAAAVPSAAQPQQGRKFRPLKQGLKSKTIILTYHDMVPKRDSKSLWFDCSPAELTEQIETLTKWGANFLTLDDLWQGLTGQKPLPEKGVLITFADNYQGFYSHAWPILEQKGIPVTLFVHTRHVGSQKGRPKMTWQTLKELQKSGLVSVQSQTVSHPEDISSLPKAQIAGELTDSKLSIEKELQASCWSVAYPNGKFSERVAKMAEDAGYLIAFTEEQKPAESAPSIMLVPRWVHTKWREAWRSFHSQ